MRRMDAFFSADDRQEHLALLSQSASKHALDFLAWCLMSYHAHFVGLPRQEKSLALHVPEKSMQFSVKVGGSSVAGALPFLFDGRTERSGVTPEKFVKVSVSPSTIFGQIRLTCRSIQSQGGPRLLIRRNPVAFRRVNHTFPYLYPRDR